MVLTKTATSSPGTALTWLAKPSSACSGWLWLQIQFSVPGLAFSAISQGAVGTITPPASFLSTTAGCSGGAALGLRRYPLRVVLGAQAGGADEPGRPERGDLQELAAVERALRTESARARGHRPVGGAARDESLPKPPVADWRGTRDEGVAGTTYHSCVSWARSLPAPLRRPLSRLVHAAWEGAADLGAIGPGDPRGQRFGRMGAGACLLFPQGAIYNEHLIHIGAETIVGPYASISAGMAPGSGDADRSRRVDRQPHPHRPGLAHRRATGRS